jgi:hypothetical protein
VNNPPKRPNPKTQAARLLKELEARPGGLCALTILTNFDELRISHRYAASIKILRDAGYQITTTKCPTNHHGGGLRHAPGLAYYVLENYTETLF